MIKAIDEKYCKNNLVQLMPYTDACHLIIDSDEIILLKKGKKVLVNKYINHPSRHLFPYSEIEKHQVGFSSNYNELFEYNKMYLNFRGSVSGYSFQKNYFFKGTKRALFLNESLSADDRLAEEKAQELSRRELEKIFDKNNYDSIYIIDKNGCILYANNKKDGCVIDRNIIPSDTEIINLDLRRRTTPFKIGNMTSDSTNTPDTDTKSMKKRPIAEIKNLKIYGPGSLTGKYSHILITSKNGKFDINWFNLDFIEKDRFRLTTGNIPAIEPTIDDVISYSSNHTIEKTPEPMLEKYKTEPDMGEVISKIPDISEDTRIRLKNYETAEETKQQKETISQKILKKIYEKKENHNKTNH